MNSDSRFQSLSRLLAAVAVCNIFSFSDRACSQILQLDVELKAVRSARFDRAIACGAESAVAAIGGAAANGAAVHSSAAHSPACGAAADVAAADVAAVDVAAADVAAADVAAADVAAVNGAAVNGAGIAAAGSAAASDSTAAGRASNADASAEGIAQCLLAQAPVGSDMPPPSSPPQSVAPFLRNGSQLIVAGKLAEALSVFQDYCRMKPQDASGFFWMGICYDEMKNDDAAVHAYRDAVSKAEQAGMDSCELRTNLGNSLLKQQNFDGAIEAYKKALEINPIFGLADLNLGRAYVAKSDFKAALDAFAKCDELHFQAKQLQYYKAKALVGAGRSDEAGAIIQRLLQNLPPGEDKESIRQEFQSCLPAPK